MSKNYVEILAAIAAAQSEKKPRKRQGEEEHLIQVSCVNWFRWTHRDLHRNLFAVPNGGRRNITVASKLKAEGVQRGVSDLILLCKNSKYGALLIEMKTKGGKQSEEQKEWQKAMEDSGYKYVICHNLDEFQFEIENYLTIK